MPNEEVVPPRRASELLFEDLEGHIASAVGSAACELDKDAASLRGLAKSLEDLSWLPTAAGQDELRETAACIKAAAMQALAVALGALSVSEQLQAYAAIKIVTGDDECAGREETGKRDEAE